MLNRAALVMLEKLLPLLISMLSCEDARKALDQLLDRLEDWAKDSTNEIDDVVALPVIAKIREILQLPDNDLAAQRELEAMRKPR